VDDGMTNGEDGGIEMRRGGLLADLSVRSDSRIVSRNGF